MPTRCAWANGGPLEIEYHDTEWGVPSRDDRHLFEMLILEGAQAGLSWSTILRKRENYRKAFAGFDPAKVARFDARKRAALMRDPGIVRNRLKIEATVANARQVLGGPGGARQPRGLPVAVRRRQSDREPMDHAGPGAGRDRRIARDEQGAAPARLPLRGADDLLRVHASHRHGQRPCHHVLSVFQTEESTGMRIGVFGAGAIGCVVGGLLTKAGHDVTLVDQWPEHIETMKRRGLRLSGHLRRSPDPGEGAPHPRAAGRVASRSTRSSSRSSPTTPSGRPRWR